jgi:hypothetical protein
MNQVSRTDVDSFVKDELVPFRNRLKEAFSQKNPQLFSFLNALFSNQGGNKFGLQVTENGRVTGEYTLHGDGGQITDVEPGKLDPDIHHPFLGTIKPYVSIERSALEKMIGEEDNLLNNYGPTATKFLPDVTIKFLH